MFFSAGKRPRRHRCCLIESFEPRTLLTNYYFSPGGNDSASGTSSAAPWKSLTKIAQLDLDAGDKVLLQGGATFNAPAASTTNRVSDSGFESGNFNSWTIDLGNSSITSTAGDVKSGTKALKISGSTFGGRGQQVGSKLAANESYQLRLWAKLSSGTGSASGGITFYKSGVEAGRASFKIVGSTYKEYSASAVAPASFDSARIWVQKEAGTSVLCVDDFKLNETFGSIILDADDSGTAANPVMIGSYGSGRATVNAGDGHGLFAYNISGLVVEDLIFAGTWDGLAATGTNSANGITITNRLTGNTKLDFIRVDNVESRNFKWAGISVSGDNAKSGYRDVRITNSSAHDNGDVGIRVEGSYNQTSTLYAHSDVYIGWCKAYNNGGLPNKMSNSGNGILIGDVDGGIIERSVAWNNGQNCNHTGGGPVGIWAWDSNDVAIQFNESYQNKTGSNSLDGGGFDLDGGVTNSVMQYNYSHDNDGAGYLMYQFSNARAFGNNVVRYNISQNDGRDGHYGGIYMGGGSAVRDNDIYGNTIYLKPGSDPDIAAIKITGIGANNKFRNNIFYTTSGVRLLDSNSAYSTSNVQFQGNAWYAGGGGFSIKWGGTTYSDLTSWRGTGQEKNGSSNTGISSNPQLVAPGTGKTLGDASLLYTLTAYQLLANSPAINAGVNLSSFGINAGGRDFFGAGVNAGSGFDIGAFESGAVIGGSSANDRYHMRIGNSGNVELFVNADTTDDPTLVWADGVKSISAIAGNGGDDTLTLDLSRGNPLPPGGASFDGGPQVTNDEIIVLGTSGDDTVSVSGSSVAPGGAALSYSGVGDVMIDTGSGDDVLNYNSPAADVAFVGGDGTDTFTINSGTYVFNHDFADHTPDLAVIVADGAAARFEASQTLQSLIVRGDVDLDAGGDIVIRTHELEIAPGGQLDIADNIIIVDYDGASVLGSFDGESYTGLSGLIARGRADGRWNGDGIISSAAATAPMLHGVGIGEASSLLYFNEGAATALFAGQTVDATSVLIRFTYVADCDLNGLLDGDDYHRIDSAYGVGLSGFSNGDFNFDGNVDGDDMFMLDSTFISV